MIIIMTINHLTADGRGQVTDEDAIGKLIQGSALMQWYRTSDCAYRWCWMQMCADSIRLYLTYTYGIFQSTNVPIDGLPAHHP